MNLDTNHLFKVMLEAEERGDTELAQNTKQLLKDILEGTITPREEIAKEFVQMIRDKKVYDVQVRMETKSMNEIEVTTQVASLISWSLQAVQHISPLAYSYLGIPEQVSLLSRLIEGGVPQDEVLLFYKRTIPELKSGIPKKKVPPAEGQNRTESESNRTQSRDKSEGTTQ